MKKITLILCVILTSLMHSQNNLIKTIDVSDNFSFLKTELKNTKVVMLGEITHYDGNVFELKTELVKFLYKEMGFTTIAFESGTYELWKAQQEINKGTSTTKALQNALFTIWSQTKEFQPFISFFEQHKKKLKLYGFDNQITGPYGEETLFSDLYKYCKKEKLPLKLNQSDLELLIESMFLSNVFDEKDISYVTYNSELNNLLQKVSEKPNNETHFYWKQIIKNLISLGEDYYTNKKPIMSSFGTTKDDNIRDKQMASNLLEYIAKNPNEKIICWGANQHFVNNMNSVKTDIVKDFIPMGSYIKNKLQNDVYSLAIITAQDSIKLGNKWHKTPIDTLSFEWFLKQKNKPSLFIPSHQKNLNKDMLHRFFSLVTFIKSNLSQLHDGYIYLNKATPSTLIPKKNHKNKTTQAPKNKISGVVFDKATQKPIPFATILIKDSFIGTSANENGEFSLYFPNSLKNKSITISSIGYETLTIEAKNLTPKIELQSKTTLLEEVVLTSKINTKTIVSKTIDNFKKNYPTEHYNANHYANAQIKVKDTTFLDFDIISHYYNRGYNQNFRPTQNIKEIRWNIKEIKPSNNIRHFFEGTYNSVAYIRFLLQKRKLNKFIFKKEKEETYQNKDIYIIRFRTDREHFNYTNQVFLSEYSGYLYINKDDFSIVKIIENWKVTDYPDDLKMIYKSFSNTFDFIGLTNVSLETNYRKNKNEKYYLEKSIYEETGEVLEKNISSSFKKKLNLFWYAINTKNVKEIPFKSENDEFKNVKYNKEFWDTYKFPNRF